MLWVCEGCTCRYSVGAPRCPECGSHAYVEEGVMPKITVHGGASDVRDAEEPVLTAVSPMVRPAQNASKEEWIKYAVYSGWTPSVASEATKQQLIDAFKE